MATAMATFIPRATFPAQTSLPRSYYLGHHASGLARMKTMLSMIDLIIECRDYRVPLTSRNPIFESTLAGRERVIVYTKRDLGSETSAADRAREKLLCNFHEPSSVLFSDHKSRQDIKRVLKFAKDHADHTANLTGSRMLVVGMPNVGKSSLLNALRMAGVHKGKAAYTGAQPGITRKIASGVKIVERDPERDTEGVYLVDTPGVFVPYVPDAESMMKLALVGAVKDTIIPPTTLADYLLFHINHHVPEVYGNYCAPTNDIVEVLDEICKKTGRLMKGGVPDVEAAALWMIQRWRQGHMGHFLLDKVTPESLVMNMTEEVSMSISRAKKLQKDAQRARGKLRKVDAG